MLLGAKDYYNHMTYWIMLKRFFKRMKGCRNSKKVPLFKS